MRVLKNGVPQIYTLVDEQGGGVLIPWAKYALKTGDVSDLRDLFDSMVTRVVRFFYMKLAGKIFHVQ